MTLIGIFGMENEEEWMDVTGKFFEGKCADSKRVIDCKVKVILTQITGISVRRRLNTKYENGRALQSAEPSVDVIYTQITSYRTNDPNLTIDDIVRLPLSTSADRDEYVGELKTLDGYEDLTSVSEISIVSDDDGGSGDKGIDGGETSSGGGGLPVGAIVGIACGSAAFLILIVGFVYYRVQKNSDEDDGSGNGNERDATTLNSTQGAPTLGGPYAGTGSSLPTYGDTSVATVDYDYSRAYGGAGAHSLSDAGGTLGSQTRRTGAEGDDTAVGGGTAAIMSGNTVFSDDQTFDRAYEDVREELLDVYAPAGKLGVVIDTPDDGAPVVHAVKETSPIASKVQVGDKLVAVDDEDVRAMTAIKVSKLISRKSNNASRKLTIIRHVSNH